MDRFLTDQGLHVSEVIEFSVVPDPSTGGLLLLGLLELYGVSRAEV